jgi:hypothetical protein
MSVIEYLLYYLLIGIVIELWSFRKVIRLFLSKTIHKNPFDTKVRGLQNRLHSEILMGPRYKSALNFKVVMLNILLWPILLVTKK